MKLIAKVTLVTKAGETGPGGEIDIKDKDEAERLIAHGFAEVPAAKPADAAKASDEAPQS